VLTAVAQGRKIQDSEEEDELYSDEDLDVKNVISIEADDYADEDEDEHEDEDEDEDEHEDEDEDDDEVEYEDKVEDEDEYEVEDEDRAARQGLPPKPHKNSQEKVKKKSHNSKCGGKPRHCKPVV
jgi:hypothetical protein